MILMNEEGIRGGITQAIREYASANNKYIKNYNPNQKSSFLMYLDANNLYGWAMCRELPLNNFKWRDNPNDYFTTKTVLEYDEETSDKGYLLEVDIEYPKNLHEEQRDLPFFPFKDVKDKFKDELLGLSITEFIAIRPKVYGFSYEEDDTIKEEKM